MEFDKETQQKLQEMQSVEQNLQNFLMQKQNFQSQLNEIDSAVEETEKTEEDVYKIAGQVMIKAKKDDVLKELKEKKKTLDLRISTVEKQENKLREKLDSFRKEIEKKFKSAGNNAKK